MALAWRKAASIVSVLGILASPVSAGPVSAPSVVLDCASLRWSPQINSWIEVVGDVTVTGSVSQLTVKSPDTDISVSEFARGTTDRQFFASFALVPNLPASLRVHASYTAGGQSRTSNECLIDGLVRMRDFRPDFVSGADRYATAVAVTQRAYPEGASAVVVASGEDFPDAVSAGPAAAHIDAPLLLTPGKSVPRAVAEAISALAPDTIYVVGGEGSISADAYRQLSSLAPEIHRLWGPDRYATSRAVASGIFSGARSAFIASGSGFADAISATSAAAREDAPMLLVPSVPSAPVTGATTALLADLHAQRTTIVGGTAAVPAATEQAISAVMTTERLGGANRYETSVSVSEKFFGPAEKLAYLTVGTSFPDALAGTTLAASTGAPLMITEDICVPDRALIAIAGWGVEKVTLIGGTQATRPEIAQLRSCLEVGFFASHHW